MGRSCDEGERERLLAVACGAMPRASRDHLTDVVATRGTFAAIQERLSGEALRVAEEIVGRCRELDLHILSLTDNQFPLALRVIPSPPAALYIRRGEGVFAFPPKMMGVVGTRAASVEVCQRASLLSGELVKAGWCVVSGLALGVDGAAHRGALTIESPCPTIAVVAHGLDRIYPASHSPLAESILRRGGVIISEYPPGAEPMKHHFLERNRIIAALSRGVVVVQAGDRSGSLVTARFAAEFGRDVFVMSSPDNDERWGGGERLVEDGAIPITGAVEILSEYGERLARSDSSTTVTTPVQGEILSVEAYLSARGGSAGALLRDEVEGRIVRLPGNRVMIMG